MEKAKTVELVERAVELTDAESQYRIPWIVFDRDQVKDFDEIIRTAEKNSINTGWSNPCFEIWMYAYLGEMPAIREMIRGGSMRKTIKNVIFILLIITLSASTALLAYLHFFAADDKELSGEWTAELDMTGQAAVTALGWLQDIEAVSISLEDMESCMQELTIQVDLTLEQTARSEGAFRCNVVPESYDACKQAAYEAFAIAFQELLAERLSMAGYAGSTDEGAMEALVNETFGMSTVSYLMSYGPELLPPLEELQARYNGSGTYEAAEDILTRRFEAGGAVTTRVEYYIHKDTSLILYEEAGSDSSGIFSDEHPMIYTLKQSTN